MAIKYVKDFRTGTLNANEDYNGEQTIQAAVDSLEHGDTLIFENGVRYFLNSPVFLTQHKIGTDGTERVNRESITFEGNGCKISNMPAATTTGFSECNKLFVLSDNYPQKNTGSTNSSAAGSNGNGLINCTIRGFNFVGCGFSGTDNPAVICGMGVTADVAGSTYIKACTIENCTFMLFDNCLWLGGKYNTVKNCHFSLCNTAIKADCPDYGNIHSNYFYQSENTGLLLTKPYGTNVHGNTFIRCKGDSIRVDGTLDSSTDEKMLGVSIYSNYISGDLADNKIEDQNGIFVSGAKSTIIRDNIIRNMKCVNATDSTGKNQGNGICIDGVNNTHNSVVRFCNKTTVSGNQIFDCMNAGIRTDYSQDCVFSDNTVYSRTGDKAVTGDCGIRIAKNTSRNVFSNNTLYDYDDNNGIVNNAFGYTVVRGNISVPSAYSDNIASPIRYIQDSYTLEGNTGMIVIPEQLLSLSNNEVFRLYVPADHRPVDALGRSYIIYENVSGGVYVNNTETEIPESCYGGFVKLRLNIISDGDTDTYKYTIVS